MGLIPKLSKRVGLLKQLRNKMNDRSFNMISNGIFNSLIIYCLPVFGNVWLKNEEDEDRRFKSFRKEDCRRLQVLQNQTLRLKLHAHKYTPSKELTEKSGELSIHQLIAYHTLLQVHKSTLNKKPEYISSKLPLKVPGQNIFPHKQAYTISVNKELSISRSAFIYRGAHIWNQLPFLLRKCEKTESFKSQVKKWVKENVSVKPS